MNLFYWNNGIMEYWKRTKPACKYLLMVCICVCIACGKNSSKASLPVLSINGHNIRAEKAITAKERARGLMHRKKLPSDQGMLFVYFRETELSFWMKNTYIPLSIAFIDTDGVIVDIQQMEPETTVSHKSKKDALYALEVNKGWFESRGIKTGDKVEGIDQALTQGNKPHE